MKHNTSEIFTGNNGQLSSKRIIGTVIIGIAMLVPIVTLFIDPIGVIDNSVLIYCGQLLTVGGALLGLGVTEKNFKNKTEEYD